MIADTLECMLPGIAKIWIEQQLVLVCVNATVPNYWSNDKCTDYIDGLVRDYSNSGALAMELLY